MRISNSFSNELNIMRWMAALLVVVGHLRSLVYPAYSEVVEPFFIEKVFYFLTGFGHEGVIIFFVLSGYLVGGEFFEMAKTKRNTLIYLTKRFSRIYVVLVPALVLGFIVDAIGVSFFNANGIYNNALHFSAMNYSVEGRLSLGVFFGNLLMMQTSLTPTLGSNGPLWSLANEWWYYMLLPAIYFAALGKHFVVRVIAVFFVSILMALLNNELLVYFSVWLLGAFSFKFGSQVNFSLMLPLSFILVLIALVISRIDYFSNHYFHDIMLSMCLSFLMISLAYRDKATVCFAQGNKYLADFSYSLYLVHFPVATLLVAWSQYGDVRGVQLYVLTLVCAYIASIITYTLFEKRTHEVKGYLLGLQNLESRYEK